MIKVAQESNLDSKYVIFEFTNDNVKIIDDSLILLILYIRKCFLIFSVRWFQPTDSFLKTTSVIENIPLGLVASEKNTPLEKQFPLEQFSIIFFRFFILLKSFCDQYYVHKDFFLKLPWQ